MANPKVLLYIAISLDGFIASKNDDVSWLDQYQTETEDYGYSVFIKTVGTAIMGARTYMQSLEHPERLLKELKTYVLTKQQLPIPQGFNVEAYNGELNHLVNRIKKEGSMDIYVVGGGQVVSSFLNAGLLDEFHIFVVPTILGEGIALFPTLKGQVKLSLLEAVSYKSGIVQLHYAKIT
jgi:dihydrofolate reductase